MMLLQHALCLGARQASDAVSELLGQLSRRRPFKDGAGLVPRIPRVGRLAALVAIAGCALSVALHAGENAQASDCAGASALRFPGTARFRGVAVSGDGLFGALEVDIDVDVLRVGSYVVRGVLEDNGRVVANRPAWQSALDARASFSATSTGRHTVALRFSGEQIRRHGADGPYSLRLIANSDATAAGCGRILSPFLRRSAFGER